jgi:hypothetical protein
VLASPNDFSVTGLLEAVFAGVGIVAVLGAPFVAALSRSVVHKHLPDAPAMIRVVDRVTATETWQTDHAEDVKAIPTLVAVLSRLETTLDGLTKMLNRAGMVQMGQQGQFMDPQ